MKKAHLSALIYSLTVGLSFLITKLIMPYGSSTAILAHRFTIAFLAYGAYSVATKQSVRLTLDKTREWCDSSGGCCCKLLKFHNPQLKSGTKKDQIGLIRSQFVH